MEKTKRGRIRKPKPTKGKTMKRVMLTLIICLMLVSGCAELYNASFLAGSYEQRVASRRQQYINANPELPAKTVECILAGKIFMGMTTSQVEASWGHPYPVNRSVGSWGTHEQWIYRVSKYTTHYLYFSDGILTSWQD